MSISAAAESVRRWLSTWPDNEACSESPVRGARSSTLPASPVAPDRTSITAPSAKFSVPLAATSATEPPSAAAVPLVATAEVPLATMTALAATSTLAP